VQWQQQQQRQQWLAPSFKTFNIFALISVANVSGLFDSI
jgi:hypothetical protein